MALPVGSRQREGGLAPRLEDAYCCASDRMLLDRGRDGGT